MTQINSSTPVWAPEPQRAAESHMARFMQLAAERSGEPLQGWQGLYRWSIRQPAEFWGLVAEFARVIFSQPAAAVLVDGDEMPGASWFVGSRLNFAENLLAGGNARQSLIFCDERGRRRELSHAELTGQVAGVAAALRAAGLQPGDRVAAVLPNCPEAVIVMLGAASGGFVFSSAAPEFGEQALVDRFVQISPRILFVCDGYSYGGKRISTADKFARLARELPQLERLIVVPFLDTVPDIAELPDACLFDDFLVPDSQPCYLPLPFDHPLLVLYSSGTTGKPKCIVHSAGGTLIQHLKELLLHTDLGHTDTIFYYTTCGWMMWNWLISSLATGANVLLYDGSPLYPAADALWQMAAAENVTVFGTSPKFLTACEKADVRSEATNIRTILSTGAPLAPESFRYVQESLGRQVQLSSISGGTDLISCFALGNPLLPVYCGELQCIGLGMAVAVYDDTGLPIRGLPGELVCTRPFPSMPLGFWNDSAGRVYHAAYFERFPGVWTHGDYAELTEHGGVRILGRSDAILNPGGVRIGTAEVCEPALSLDEVLDCIAVAQRWNGDVRVVLFVVLAQQATLSHSLQLKISSSIRNAASPRHVPAVILEVPEVPRTLSGKPVELAVRAAVNDEPVDNLDAIANPEVMQYFVNRPELMQTE